MKIMKWYFCFILFRKVYHRIANKMKIAVENSICFSVLQMCSIASLRKAAYSIDDIKFVSVIDFQNVAKRSMKWIALNEITICFFLLGGNYPTFDCLKSIFVRTVRWWRFWTGLALFPNGAFGDSSGPCISLLSAYS